MLYVSLFVFRVFVHCRQFVCEIWVWMFALHLPTRYKNSNVKSVVISQHFFCDLYLVTKVIQIKKICKFEKFCVILCSSL